MVRDICSIYSSAGRFYLGFCLDLISQIVLRGTDPEARRPISLGNDLVTLEDNLFFEGPFAIPDNVSSAQPAMSSGKRVDVHHPFVTKTYKSVANATSSTATLPYVRTIYSVTAEQPSAHDDSVNLLTLARILLRIRTCRRIEDLRRSEDMGLNALPNEATDLQTLKRWIQQEKGNLSFAFREPSGIV